MSTVRRKSRQRLTERDPLVNLWQAGQPPPEWAYQPGEHHDDVIGLYFALDGHHIRDCLSHPRRAEWAAAMDASRPLRASAG